MNSPHPPVESFRQAVREFDLDSMRHWLTAGHPWPRGLLDEAPWVWAVGNLVFYLASPEQPLARRAQGLPPRLPDTELLRRWEDQLELLLITQQDAGALLTDRTGKIQGGCLHELVFKASVRPLPSLTPFVQALLEKVPEVALEVTDHRGWTAQHLIEEMGKERSSNHNLDILVRAFGARVAAHRRAAVDQVTPSQKRRPERPRS